MAWRRTLHARAYLKHAPLAFPHIRYLEHPDFDGSKNAIRDDYGRGKPFSFFLLTLRNDPRVSTYSSKRVSSEIPPPTRVGIGRSVMPTVHPDEHSSLAQRREMTNQAISESPSDTSYEADLAFCEMLDYSRVTAILSHFRPVDSSWYVAHPRVLHNTGNVADITMMTNEREPIIRDCHARFLFPFYTAATGDWYLCLVQRGDTQCIIHGLSQGEKVWDDVAAALNRLIAGGALSVTVVAAPFADTYEAGNHVMRIVEQAVVLMHNLEPQLLRSLDFATWRRFLAVFYLQQSLPPPVVSYDTVESERSSCIDILVALADLETMSCWMAYDLDLIICYEAFLDVVECQRRQMEEKIASLREWQVSAPV